MNPPNNTEATLTPVDVNAIRARAEASSAFTMKYLPGATYPNNPEPPEWILYHPDGSVMWGDSWPGDGADIKFLSAARGDVVALCNEIERLRELLWVTKKCWPCGGTEYRYNRADDPKGSAARKAHFQESPACELPF